MPEHPFHDVAISGIFDVAHARVRDVEVAMCSNGGAGTLFTDAMLLGVERP